MKVLIYDEKDKIQRDNLEYFVAMSTNVIKIGSIIHAPAPDKSKYEVTGIRVIPNPPKPYLEIAVWPV